MVENQSLQITERELREAELQMGGRLPASATAFIGFVPAVPASHNGAGQASRHGTPVKPAESK